VVFWVVKPCRLVGGAVISEERVTSIIRLQVTSALKMEVPISSETFSKDLQDYTVSQSRRSQLAARG
jgi:hypothetical protein